MTDARDLCACCATPLVPEEGAYCTRCDEVAKAYGIDTIIERMRAAAAEHRRLLAMAMTLLAVHHQEPTA